MSYDRSFSQYLFIYLSRQDVPLIMVKQRKFMHRAFSWLVLLRMNDKFVDTMWQYSLSILFMLAIVWMIIFGIVRKLLILFIYLDSPCVKHFYLVHQCVFVDQHVDVKCIHRRDFATTSNE